MLRRGVKPPQPSPVNRILRRHTGRLNRLAGRRFGPFELLSTDFTRLVYQQGSRRAWLIAFYDPAICMPCGWAVGPHANTDLALQAWKQVQRTFARYRRSLSHVTLHSDQDPVFKSYRWLYQVLCRDGVEVSYSEQGAKDNPWIESNWSRLKDEHGQPMYDCDTIVQLEEQVSSYYDYFIWRRRHQSLDYRIPIEAINEIQNNGEPHSQARFQLVL